MAITIFRSTDAGAPSYTNVAGALLGVLDKLTTVGWTKTVLGTNQASYTQPSGSNGRILQVDDSNAAFAKVNAWETLTAFNTGTNQFPNAALNANTSSYFVDHATTSSAVPWRLITNGPLFHFVPKYNTASALWNLLTFGDYYAYGVNAYNTMLGGESGNASALMGYLTGLTVGFSGATSIALALNRSVNQVSLSPPCNVCGAFPFCGNFSAPGTGGPTYPDPISGGVYISPFWLGDLSPDAQSSGTLAGSVPGLWNILHNTPFNDGDTFNVTAGPANGRSFEVVGQGTASNGQILIETSNTWGGF